MNRKTKSEGRKSRRSVDEIPILEPVSVDQVLQRCTNKRDACLVAILYLTGRRIGEVLSLKRGDFTLANPERVTFACINEKNFRKKREGAFSLQVPEHPDRYYQKIQPSYSTRGPSGTLLGHYVTDHLQDLADGDYLFSPDRQSNHDHINQPRAYQILRRLDDRLWLHALRHINFTRMARVYRDDPLAMHRLTFHKRFESTIGYVQEIEKGERLAKL